MESLIQRLHDEGASCVIRNGASVRSFHERGVKDLYRLLHEEPEFLHGAEIADKVVGKGAAALMAAGGIRALCTDLISRPALDLLTGTGIAVRYGEAVPHIIDRTGTGICPVERLCADTDDIRVCVARIGEFVRTISVRPQG